MAALGSGVDALSIAAPVLKSGPSAYETTIARMGIEGDQAKLAAAKDAAAREAAVKQKDATLKAATLDPGTVFAPHSMMYLQKRKDAQDWLQGYMEKSGGEMPGIDTPEYGQWEAIKAGLKQFESNSKQAEADYNVMAKLIAEDAKSGNPRFRKDAPSRINEIYSNPDLPDKGLLPERITGLYDLEGQIATTFGKIAKEQEAWASQDGTRSGTKEYIPSDAFLTVAETFATDPYAAAELQERFKSYTPEKQQWIMDYAEKLGTNSDVAMTVDMATGLYDRVRKTAQSEQKSDASYGIEKEKAASNELVEMYTGIVEGTHRGMTPKEAFKKDADLVALAKTVSKNESLQPYVTAKGGGEFEMKPGYRLITNLNRLSTGVKTPANKLGTVQKPIERKVRFAIQDENTKNIIVVSATDSDWASGAAEVTEAISPSQVWSKVFVPGEIYTGEGKTYPIGSGELALKERGIGILGTEASINPENKGATYVAPGTAEKGTSPKQETAAERFARISAGK